MTFAPHDSRRVNWLMDIGVAHHDSPYLCCAFSWGTPSHPVFVDTTRSAFSSDELNDAAGDFPAEHRAATAAHPPGAEHAPGREERQCHDSGSEDVTTESITLLRTRGPSPHPVLGAKPFYIRGIGAKGSKGWYGFFGRPSSPHGFAVSNRCPIC